MRRCGIVYLVGAGPGDAGLITLRGLEVLQNCDVVIYDRLAPRELLWHARADAELVDAGKAPGAHALSQDAINALLAERAMQGKAVCRLKGGDPWLFGRGAEEAAYLAERGLAFEIIPGVTAATAAAAYAGIPLTHRDIASSVILATGHSAPNRAAGPVDWSWLGATSGTLVLFMAMGRLQEIADALIAGGRPAATAVAVVENATTPLQRTVTGTLGSIADAVSQAGIGSPALVIVGDVVGLRQKLAWVEKRPLWGVRTLVLRARHQAPELGRILRAYGAAPVEAPMIRVTEPDDGWCSFDHELTRIVSHDWLVFASANAVEATLGRLRALGSDIRALAGPRIAAIGPGTAAALERLGLTVSAMPQEHAAEALAETLAREGWVGCRVLIARAQESRGALERRLQELGASVSSAICYKTELIPESAERVRELITTREVDAIALTSSSIARHFAACLEGEDLKERLASMMVACIGPVTAQSATAAGLSVHVVPPVSTIEAMVEAMAGERARRWSDQHG